MISYESNFGPRSSSGRRGGRVPYGLSENGVLSMLLASCLGEGRVALHPRRQRKKSDQRKVERGMGAAWASIRHPKRKSSLKLETVIVLW